MTPEPTLQAVRAGLWGHLNTDVAELVGMPYGQLQALVAGRYRPTEKQLHQLWLLLRLLEAQHEPH